MNHPCLFIVWFAVLTTALPAAELFVPSQFPTIQGAVDAAGDGDIITISPGTYVEIIKVKGSNLTFRSIDPTNAEVRESTQLHLSASDSLFDFTKFPVSGEFRFEGLFLRGSSRDYGGSIKGIPEIRIVVEGCKFFFCGASFEGGAIYNTKGIIRNTIFDDCRVLTAQDVDFTIGGAISRFDGLIENCNFLDNFSDGILVNDRAAFGSGGAIGNSSGTIRNCRFTRNRAVNRGGAISGFQGLIEDCFFEQNSATNFGGALSGIGSGSLINRCVFVKNSAGGTAVLSSSTVDVTNSLFFYNTAKGSGGVSALTTGTYLNCVFYGNNAALYGSTIIGHFGDIKNSIFWANTSGDGTLFEQNLRYPQYSIIQGTQPDDRGNFGADPLFIDPTIDANNMPRNFRLQPLSPAIDRGLRTFDSGTSTSIALQTDADSLPRPVVNYPTIIFNRGDGFGTDIGAYEHQTVYEGYPESGELWMIR